MGLHNSCTDDFSVHKVNFPVHCASNAETVIVCLSNKVFCEEMKKSCMIPKIKASFLVEQLISEGFQEIYDHNSIQISSAFENNRTSGKIPSQDPQMLKFISNPDVPIFTVGKAGEKWNEISPLVTRA